MGCCPRLIPILEEGIAVQVASRIEITYCTFIGIFGKKKDTTYKFEPSPTLKKDGTARKKKGEKIELPDNLEEISTQKKSDLRVFKCHRCDLIFTIHKSEQPICPECKNE